MKKLYIGKKYEDNTWYDMYYDNDLEMINLVPVNEQDIEFFYKPKKEDLVALTATYELLITNEAKRVEKSRKARRKKIKEELFVLVFAILSGLAIDKISQPTTQYNIKYIFSEDEQKDDLTHEYLNKVIDENETISNDFKKYLINFFNELDSLNCTLNQITMTRILNNIEAKDFSNITFTTPDSLVVGLTEVISDQSDISVRMLSLEYFEHYNEIDASFKSRFFDAINARTNNELLWGILSYGDSYYNEYLRGKYGITEDKANKIMSLIGKCYVSDVRDITKYENYISTILAFNYNFGSNYLKVLEGYTTYSDLVNGHDKYSYNLFENTIKLTICYDYCTFDVYYDTKYDIDITSLEYHNRFDELMSNFDGSIDINDPNDRVLLYLFTLAGLKNEDINNGEKNDYLYTLGETYFGYNFYSYLSGNEFGIEELCSCIIDLSMAKDLNKDDLALLNEVLVSINKEAEEGKTDPYLFELMFKYLSYCVNENCDKKTFLEWQDNVISLVEPDNVNEIINRYRDNVSRLTKSEN